MSLRPARSATAQAFPPRPPGELLWAHATTPHRLMALDDLCCRLQSARPGLRTAISWEPEMISGVGSLSFDTVIGPLPSEQNLDSKRFLAEWHPDVCLWTGGMLRRSLVRLFGDHAVDALLADITEEELPGRKIRWLPDQRRRLFDGFGYIVTSDKSVQTQLLRTGVKTEITLVSDRLGISTSPPTCANDDLTTMQSVLGSRPVWLSAQTPVQKLADILEAHRNALRLLHRLLLIVSLDSPLALEEARETLQKSGLQFALWDDGEEPNEHCHVLLAGPEDLGLWYRLSPICLMAATLFDECDGQSPLDAAALGSAVIHGVDTGPHRALYEQLSKAGAAELIKTGKELAEMVVFLSAPDRAAEMALAGWETVTAGAATTDFLVEKIQDLLDQREEHNATP